MSCCNKCDNNFCLNKANKVEMVACEQFTSKDRKLQEKVRADEKKLREVVAAWYKK